MYLNRLCIREPEGDRGLEEFVLIIRFPDQKVASGNVI